MQRFKLTGCAALMLMAAVSAARGEDGFDPFTMAQDPQVSRNISRLSDPDPANRADAVQRLRNLGEAARPALRRALVEATPAIRSEIDQVLVHIPWIKPGDSDAVEEKFTGYAELDSESRCDRVDLLGQLQNAAESALLRVLQNDPSPSVRWEAAAQLQQFVDGNPAMKSLLIGLIDGTISSDQSYLPAMKNIPLVALAGWACRLDNPDRATHLINMAIDAEQYHPTAFRWQTDFAYTQTGIAHMQTGFAYKWLLDRATQMRDHARKVDLLRQQADRAAWDNERVPDAVTRLFAEQVNFGPFPGFTDDLRTYQEYFTHPEMVYILGRLAQRKGHPDLAAAINTIALLMSGNSTEDHYLAGIFLLGQGWDDPAERELKTALRLSGGKSADIYFELATLAEDRDDDLSAAKNLEIFLQKTDSHDIPNIDLEWAEVHMHYLRAARYAGDTSTVKLHLDKLMEMDQQSQIVQREPGLASDIIPALQQEGHTEQADAMFDVAYHGLKEKMAAAPWDPMQKNNLAWLCACCGKHLDEAVKLAGEAVAADPDNAASLDTQAEAFFRIGQPAKAMEIEAHALEIKPDDLYMQKQIERFKKTASAKPPIDQ